MTIPRSQPHHPAGAVKSALRTLAAPKSNEGGPHSALKPPAVHPNGNGDARAPVRQLRIALVDPDHRTHDFVRTALAPWQVTTYTCPRAALESLPALSPAPDLVLMGTSLPGLSGVECLRKLKPAAPNLRVIMLTHCSDPSTIIDCVRAAAWGYIVKPVRADVLHRVVEDSTVGLRTFGSEAQTALANHAQRLGISGRAQALTMREREVMLYVAQGCQNKEIAERLHIASKSVTDLVYRVCKKFKVGSRVEALREFLRD